MKQGIIIPNYMYLDMPIIRRLMKQKYFAIIRQYTVFLRFMIVKGDSELRVTKVHLYDSTFLTLGHGHLIFWFSIFSRAIFEELGGR